MKYGDAKLRYGVHPSEELGRLFREKPYQGNNPFDARVLVIGNDANYSPEISDHKFFERILDYHADGVAFWRRTSRHHPFLLDDYPFDRRKGGVRYHQNFGKMKFGPDNAGQFSFVELLNVPTIGKTGSDKELFYRLLDKDHLAWLERLVFGGEKKFVLVNQTLARSIGTISKRFGVLGDLASALKDKPAPGIGLETNNVVLYNGYSFSHSIKNEYLLDLANKIRQFIEDGGKTC